MSATLIDVMGLTGIMSQSIADEARLDRRINQLGEQLSAMILAGELSGAPLCAVLELQDLPLALMDVADEVSVLMQTKAPRGWSMAVALGVASGALLFAGAQTVAIGEPLLGIAEMVASAGIAVWASLVRG